MKSDEFFFFFFSVFQVAWFAFSLCGVSRHSCNLKTQPHITHKSAMKQKQLNEALWGFPLTTDVKSTYWYKNV